MNTKEPLALTYVPGMNIALCRDVNLAGSLWVWHYMYHSDLVDRTTSCPRPDGFLEPSSDESGADWQPPHLHADA